MENSMLSKEEIRKHYIFSTTHELDDHNKMLKQYIIELENKVEQLETKNQKLIEKLEECAESYYTLNEDEEYERNKNVEEFATEILSILKGENDD